MPAKPAVGQARELRFERYEEVRDEIRRLRSGGYTRLGNWSLGQMCAHLDYYFRGSLDGFGFQFPAIMRFLVRKLFLKRILGERRMKYGMQTVATSVPGPETDDDAAVDAAVESLDRLAARRAPLHPSAIFGQLSDEAWRQLHLTHAAHHLRLLIPQAAGDGEAHANT